MKNRIMIVRGENDPITKQEVQELYRFLVLVGGNYRNAVYIECSCRHAVMLTTDQDAKPMLLPLQTFYELTGEYPQKDEMCGTLTQLAFENLFRGWLLWNTDGAKCPVCSMYAKMKAEVLSNE